MGPGRGLTARCCGLSISLVSKLNFGPCLLSPDVIGLSAFKGHWYSQRSLLTIRTDFLLALFFGVFFQYFSIAPMSGEWGPKSLLRAAKADFLSLAFFEIGLFGWMAIFQIAIFKYRLDMASVTYWWMMQVCHS